MTVTKKNVFFPAFWRFFADGWASIHPPMDALKASDPSKAEAGGWVQFSDPSTEVPGDVVWGKLGFGVMNLAEKVRVRISGNEEVI